MARTSKDNLSALLGGAVPPKQTTTIDSKVEVIAEPITKAKKMPMKTMNISVPTWFWKALKIRSAKIGKSASSVIVESVIKYFDELGNPLNSEDV